MAATAPTLSQNCTCGWNWTLQPLPSVMPVLYCLCLLHPMLPLIDFIIWQFLPKIFILIALLSQPSVCQCFRAVRCTKNNATQALYREGSITYLPFEHYNTLLHGEQNYVRSLFLFYCIVSSYVI